MRAHLPLFCGAVLALLCATQAVPLSRPGVKSSPAEDLGDSDDVGVSRMWADDPALDGGWEGEATERGAPPPAALQYFPYSLTTL